MNFISPKNFKSGRLISNKFTAFDLVLMFSGMLLSFILIAIYVIYFVSEDITTNFIVIFLFLLPGLVCFGLVQPNGIYHNFLSFISLLLIHIKSQKKYIWGGLYRNEIVEDETE